MSTAIFTLIQSNYIEVLASGWCGLVWDDQLGTVGQRSDVALRSLVA